MIKAIVDYVFKARLGRSTLRLCRQQQTGINSFRGNISFYSLRRLSSFAHEMALCIREQPPWAGQGRAWGLLADEGVGMDVCSKRLLPTCIPVDVRLRLVVVPWRMWVKPNVITATLDQTAEIVTFDIDHRVWSTEINDWQFLIAPSRQLETPLTRHW